jgi:hypothetical protein
LHFFCPPGWRLETLLEYLILNHSNAENFGSAGTRLSSTTLGQENQRSSHSPSRARQHIGQIGLIVGALPGAMMTLIICRILYQQPSKGVAAAEAPLSEERVHARVPNNLL